MSTDDLALQASQGLPASQAAQALRRAPVTDRVNVEPAILLGMTATEAKVITAVSLPLFLLVALLVWAATGVWQAVLVLGLFGPLGTMWVAAGRLASIKRGRPDGHYTQAMHLWLADRGLRQCRYIRHHGQWSLGRGFGADISSPLDTRRFKGQD